MSDTDLELLKCYTRDHADDAFAEIVRRHLPLVHSAALRQVRSPRLAEEVAQSAFTDLARNAHRLAPDTILTAWLYQVTRRTAIDVVRREARRQLREQIATEINAMNATTAEWTHIEPLLDEAMSALDETDRAAVLLRYFENKSLREVGQTLGTSDDAAQKRVSRAVERLREFFAKRGVTVGAGGLAVVLSAHAVQAAPVGLAITISTAAAFAGTTIVTTAIKTIAMTTLQKTLVTATVAVLAGAGIYEARQASQLRDQVQTLQQLQAPLAEQIQKLQSERVDASNRLSSLADGVSRMNGNSTELLKLRGDVARLRKDANDPMAAEAKVLLGRVNQLKQRLEQMPDTKIPELQLATKQDWLNAASRKLDTDIDYRRALSSLRSTVENRFGSTLRPALKKYVQANGGQFPTDLTQLQPYFDSPVDDAILQRWQIAPAKENPNMNMGGDWIITEKAPVDDVFDSRITVGTNGYGSSDFLSATTGKTMAPVWSAFATANNGRDVTDVSELLPYATTPDQQVALQKLILRDSASK